MLKEENHSLFCNKCSKSFEKRNLNDFYKNKNINKKKILGDSKENEKLEDKDLRVNLYFDEENQEDNLMINNNIINDPDNNDIQADIEKKIENPFKKSSLAELRLSNLNESSERFSFIKKNPYSCKNMFLTNFNSLKNEKNKNFPDEKNDRYFNEKPDCVPKIKTPLGTCKNIEKSNPYRSYFSFNYNSPKPELHRFSIENFANNSSTSRVLTVEQITLIHNIKDKLEIIKGYDYLDIEENENEENNDLFYNVDENFDSNVEWENRSKINRNINEGGNNKRKMSEILSPDHINSSNNVINILSANEIFDIYEKTKSDNGVSKNYEEKVDERFNEMIDNEKEINLDFSHFSNNELNSLYENSNFDFHDSIDKIINLTENKNENTQENLKFHKKTKKLQILNDHTINNFALEIDNNSKIDKFTKNSKENLSIPCLDDKINIFKNNFENNCLKDNINNNKHLSHSFVDNFNNEAVSIPFDNFNKSMDLKMKSRILNLDKKKNMIDNLGLNSNEKNNIEQVQERKNFLHIKIDENNKSRIYDNNGDIQIGNKFLDKSNIAKEKNIIARNLETSMNISKNIIKKDNEENENEKILKSLINEEKYNSIYDEYSTIDRRNQNTRNIKEFNRISIKEKNNVKKN